MAALDRTFEEFGRGIGPLDESQSGLSLIEALTATVLLAMMFLALAGVFGSNLESMSRAQATTRASMFADRILSSCEAQSGAALLAMNGNSFFDGSDERVSRFRATLVVEVSSAALLTLRLDIADLRSGDEILSLLTLRQRT